MALAALPITATCLPERSTSWFQRAEWKRSPRKPSIPGMSGMCGRLSCPTALTSTSTVISSPSVVRSRQTLSPSSKRAPAISVENRMCRRTSYFRAQCSM